jgi:hypothetical protein
MGWTSDVRSQMRTLDRSRRALRRFGFTMGIALGVLASLVFFFGDHPGRAAILGAFGAALLLSAWLTPRVLGPIQKGWMAFAFALGWIMSRALLSVFFFVAVTPVGLLVRLFGKNPLEARDVDGSYWIRRPRREPKPEEYERLF